MRKRFNTKVVIKNLGKFFVFRLELEVVYRPLYIYTCVHRSSRLYLYTRDIILRRVDIIQNIIYRGLLLEPEPIACRSRDTCPISISFSVAYIAALPFSTLPRDIKL